MTDDPMKQDFATDGPFSDIFRRLADIEKKLRDIQSNPIPTAVSDFAYMAGNGRTLQMVEVNGQWADTLPHTLTGTWPTAFSSLDTAWFTTWNTFDIDYSGVINFTANVNNASGTVIGINALGRIQYIRFFGIGVL